MNSIAALNHESEIEQLAQEHGFIKLIQPGSLSVGGKPSEETLAQEWVGNNRANWRYDHGIQRWFHTSTSKREYSRAEIATRLAALARTLPQSDPGEE